MLLLGFKKSFRDMNVTKPYYHKKIFPQNCLIRRNWVFVHESLKLHVSFKVKQWCSLTTIETLFSWKVFTVSQEEEDVCSSKYRSKNSSKKFISKNWRNICKVDTWNWIQNCNFQRKKDIHKRKQLIWNRLKMRKRTFDLLTSC